jgi:hypothetical protein
MEAFITRSNAERIVKQLNLSDIDVNEFGKQMKFKWFNKGELRKLKAFEMLFSNPELFLSHFVTLKPREDKNNYVFQSNAAFHTNENCTRMHSDFNNIKIPEEIIKSGRKQEFIQFCKDHSELHEKYPDQFRNRLKWRFNITSDILVHYENSGYQAIENMTLKELENSIETKIEKFNCWIGESQFNRKVIEKYGFQSFNYKNPNLVDLKKISDTAKREDVINILKHFELNIKYPLIKFMTYSYQMKNNSSLSFESTILTELGFKQCSHC